MTYLLAAGVAVMLFKLFCVVVYLRRPGEDDMLDEYENVGL